jgi:spore maturation protein CgeB
MRIVVFGLSVTSAWGNGHASTYRSLLKALARRGHEILFLERDVPWYAENRDLPTPRFARVELYRTRAELDRFTAEIASADLVIVGSYVPEGVEIADLVLREARGVRAFYDIDTPITLDALEVGDAEYLRRDQVPRFDIYFSFSGGPVLDRLEREFGAAEARPLYCSIEADADAPPPPLAPESWRLGYLGTYSEDRQSGLEMRLLEPARRLPGIRFVVAGAQFPAATVWPANVDRIEHVPPAEHQTFFAAQRYTLNVTRRAMIAAGYSPSVRLFEAAASGVPIVSDPWPGLETFLAPGREILVTRSAAETMDVLVDLPDTERRAIAARARQRILAQHTSDHRAAEVERCVTR